jgi:hypothetical protein
MCSHPCRPLSRLTLTTPAWLRATCVHPPQGQGTSPKWKKGPSPVPLPAKTAGTFTYEVVRLIIQNNVLLAHFCLPGLGVRFRRRRISQLEPPTPIGLPSCQGTPKIAWPSDSAVHTTSALPCQPCTRTETHRPWQQKYRELARYLCWLATVPVVELHRQAANP